MLTDKQIQALEIVKSCGPITPRSFSSLMWPDAEAHHRHYNVGNGATTGVGMWRSAGGYLAKLANMGYIKRQYWDLLGGKTYSSGYAITDKGNTALLESKKDPV
jgi:hypothetical protein